MAGVGGGPTDYLVDPYFVVCLRRRATTDLRALADEEPALDLKVRFESMAWES
jgi:hypothetical protein